MKYFQITLSINVAYVFLLLLKYTVGLKTKITMKSHRIGFRQIAMPDAQLDRIASLKWSDQMCFWSQRTSTQIIRYNQFKQWLSKTNECGVVAIAYQNWTHGQACSYQIERIKYFSVCKMASCYYLFSGTIFFSFIKIRSRLNTYSKGSAQCYWAKNVLTSKKIIRSS